MEVIRIRGARTHNLKNINLELPRNRLIVITGLSGSGKSSLAFDTIYAEGQRRYVESLSAYARQFLSMMEKPDVDHIEGLSPAISIEQKTTSHNPRSTVGTVTEIYDYLRLLFARVGEPTCPTHGMTLHAQTISQMVDKVTAMEAGERLMLLAPIVSNRKGEHQQLLDDLSRQGFIRARINGEIVELNPKPALDKNRKHRIDVVVDRFRVRNDLGLRLAESFETALRLSDGVAYVSSMDDTSKPDLVFSSLYACPQCGYSIGELEPRSFSFNNPAGACPNCDGLGIKQFFDPQRIILDPELSLSSGAIRGWDRRNAYYFSMLNGLSEHYKFDIDTPYAHLPQTVTQLILYGSGEEEIEFHYYSDRGHQVSRTHRFEGIIPNMERRYRDTESTLVREELSKFINTRQCPECQGNRLNEAARHVLIQRHNLPQITALPIDGAHQWFKDLNLRGKKREIADKILLEIEQRLQFLINVGLEYLTLDRSADSLSGGESQRIRLASQIGAGLVGVMYVLDEPSIGLHQRDNQRLLNTLNYLRDLGNTVIVVEHDEDAIRSADYVVDIGPGAGVHGGEIVTQGKPDDIMDCPTSLTGQYLSGTLTIHAPEKRLQPAADKWLRLHNAHGNNLKNVTLELPTGLFTCITGVSGSGKSTLVNDTLYRLAARQLMGSKQQPAPFGDIENLQLLDKVIDIDQSPIGRTPRSNPATYTGLFTPIRELFAGTQESRSRGYTPGRFSFNVKGGRCEACQGDGLIKVEMHFLPDIYVPCDICHGQRYNRETLTILYK